MNSKAKIRVLVLGIFLTLLICYKFAIRNTLRLKEEYKIQSLEQKSNKDMLVQLMLLKEKQKSYDSILQKMNWGNLSFENNFLKVINTEAKNRDLKVIDFNNPHELDAKGGTLYTYDFSLEGGFTDIIRAVKTIENDKNLGEVVHLNIEKKKDYKSNTHFLHARVLLQNAR